MSHKLEKIYLIAFDRYSILSKASNSDNKTILKIIAKTSKNNLVL